MYIEQSYKGKTEWWRYLLTFFIVLVAKLISEIPISVLAAKKAVSSGDISNVKAYLNAEAIGITDNLYFLTMFGPLVIVFGVLVLCMHLIHGFTFTQVFTAYRKFRWKNFLGAAFLWLFFLIIVEVIHYLAHPEYYSFNFRGNEFLVLLIMGLFFVPFQASAEELYFRGNLLQGVGILFRSRFITVLFTSFIFGLMHLGNPEVAEFGFLPAMAQYIGFGLLLGIVVVMDGGLEMAFGMHTINNFYLICFVSYSGSVINTPSLFHTKEIDITIMTLGFYAAAILYLILLKKLFKWKSLGWLFKPVQRPEARIENF